MGGVEGNGIYNGKKEKDRKIKKPRNLINTNIRFRVFFLMINLICLVDCFTGKLNTEFLENFNVYIREHDGGVCLTAV